MNIPDILTYLSLASLVLHFIAQAIVIFTKTPDPSTMIGKIYEVVEAAAGLIGNAKDVFKPDGSKDP